MSTEEAGALPALPRREPYRTWRGSLVVLAVILVLVGTLVVWDDNTSGAQELAPGTVLDVGRGVTFVPADGWSLMRDRTTPGSSAAVASRGGSFTVRVSEWDDSPASEVDRTRRSILADDTLRVVGDGSSFHTSGGLTGTQLTYVGTGVQGRAWIAVDDDADLSVVVFAPSPPETYQQVSSQVDAMLDSIRMTGVDS